MERAIQHVSTGGEAETYVWSQRASPEICSCTGGSRVCSRALRHGKGGPGPCLGETARWTQSGVRGVGTR